MKAGVQLFSKGREMVTKPRAQGCRDRLTLELVNRWNWDAEGLGCGRGRRAASGR